MDKIRAPLEMGRFFIFFMGIEDWIFLNYYLVNIMKW